MTRLVIAAALLLFVFTGYAYWTSQQAYKYQSELGPGIRERFGFAYGSPYVVAGGKKIEVFTVYPDEDGFLYEVGFRSGNIVVSESITGFHKLLYQDAGTYVEVVVVPGGDGLALTERPQSRIQFRLPER